MDAERARILQQPETSPAVAVKSANMCYIIFTSGSTGRPKGTVLQHAGVVNYFLSLVECVFASMPFAMVDTLFVRVVQS